MGKEAGERQKKMPLLVMHGSLHDALPGEGVDCRTQITEAASFLLFFFFLRRCRLVDQKGDHPADNTDKKEEGG